MLLPAAPALSQTAAAGGIPWNGGVRQFLIHQQCEPDVIERIMAKEQNS